jgi:hydrogenase nickel incorporation protein HypA/HybF
MRKQPKDIDYLCKKNGMHELSIAISIVETVGEQLKEHDAKEAAEVELEIGSMSGVVIEALQFALEEAVKSSMMQHARITIREIPARMRCLACTHEFEPVDVITPCPACGHLYADLIAGGDMKIMSIKF